MLQPMFGAELARARVGTLAAEALRDRRLRRRSRKPRRHRGGLRLALGVRLVSAGYRLLGDAVEVR
ncbi:MAG TPA: hypothetical protein VFT27_01405 [Actinomycetota bacterium]|nr:hypothetical protein [Actinomycetota bacterium]